MVTASVTALESAVVANRFPFPTVKLGTTHQG
jgi:hypothetical protein